MSTLCAVVLGLAALAAQGPAEAEGAYRVGPGDVLDVRVEGRADLARLPTVQTSGTIFLPGAGDVEVRGLTTREIAARLSSSLAAAGAPPRVDVRVREYQSQFVWVRGAVNRPGRKALRDGTRLVDALLDAGGFAPGASGRLTVERAAGDLPDGARRRVVRLSGGTPSADELAELSLALRAGDTVTAEPQAWVSVAAGVVRPGRYPFDDGLTLGRLVDYAGGRAGGGRVVVRRAGAETEADLDAIREGRAADVALAAGDEVVARTRGR
jgi:polysaccharide export outer membrane protein